MLSSKRHTNYVCHSKTPANNPTKNLKIVVANGDIAVLGQYWREKDIDCLQNVIDKKGSDVTLPDRSRIDSTQQGKLSLPSSLSKRGFNFSGTTILKELIDNIISSIM